MQFIRHFFQRQTRLLKIQEFRNKLIQMIFLEKR